MINLTYEQKRKIRSEIEALSEVISDLSSTVEPGERGSITIASDNFRKNYGVDLIIQCPEKAKKYIAQAFSEFNINIFKQANDFYNNKIDMLGVTLEEYKHLMKGSIILFLEHQKELALNSPEGEQVKLKLQKELDSLISKLTIQNSNIIYH